MEEWQAKRRPLSGGVPRLTTGFLDGTHPIVDAYELKVGRPGLPPRPSFATTHEVSIFLVGRCTCSLLV